MSTNTSGYRLRSTNRPQTAKVGGPAPTSVSRKSEQPQVNQEEELKEEEEKQSESKEESKV